MDSSIGSLFQMQEIAKVLSRRWIIVRYDIRVALMCYSKPDEHINVSTDWRCFVWRIFHSVCRSYVASRIRSSYMVILCQFYSSSLSRPGRAILLLGSPTMRPTYDAAGTACLWVIPWLPLPSVHRWFARATTTKSSLTTIYVHPVLAPPPGVCPARASS